MLNRQLPAYMLNLSYWLLIAPANSPHAAAAFYKENGPALPVADMMGTEMAAAISALAANEKRVPLARPKAAGKPIYHYLLLPTFEWGVSDWHWTAALEYIHKFQPTCGFSAAEAQAAEHVTIVGNEQGVSIEIENQLRAAGCNVERICGRDGDETQQRLSEMAESGKRFLIKEMA